MGAIMSQMCLLRRWDLFEVRGFCCTCPAPKERCEGGLSAPSRSPEDIYETKKLKRRVEGG